MKCDASTAASVVAATAATDDIYESTGMRDDEGERKLNRKCLFSLAFALGLLIQVLDVLPLLAAIDRVEDRLDKQVARALEHEQTGDERDRVR